MPHRIVREELDLLARVSEALARAAPRAGAAEAAALQELERIRGVILSGEESKDQAALFDEWRRQSSLLRQLQTGRVAEVDRASPYFGHLRLGGPGGERDLCIGRTTRLESGLRIVDWRNAPISRLYFRYLQDEEFEEEFGGRMMTGRVLARRAVKIEAGALQQIDAPEGTFRTTGATGEWQELASEPARLGSRAVAVHAPGMGAGRRMGGPRHALRADKRLPEITGLLDPTQFGLITRPSAGHLSIRGVAGSGKTTVALHRIAYLAFAEPRIDSSDTLVLVYSRALQRYVEHVLPSLGLGRVGIRTYRQWAHDQRTRHFPELPRATREDTPPWVQALKLHPGLMRALEAEVASEPGAADAEQAREDWTNLLVNRDRLHEHLAGDPNAPVPAHEIDEFAAWHRRRNGELADFLAGDTDTQIELDPEDDPLLLRAWQLRVGPLQRPSGRPLRYRHVTIDEVQDLSPLEVQVVLDCLDDEQSITLAGDTQQHLARAGGFDSWSEFLASVGVPGSSIDTLRVPYRSTSEILEFALEVLGSLREDELDPQAARAGSAVEIFRFGEPGACVAMLCEALEELQLREPLASVALLAPTEDASAEYARGFAQTDLRVRHVRDHDFTFRPGIELATVEQSKGLEFDYVILLDVDPVHYPDGPYHRRLLHVGATRAVHQLWLTCTGLPSPILASARLD